MRVVIITLVVAVSGLAFLSVMLDDVFTEFLCSFGVKERQRDSLAHVDHLADKAFQFAKSHVDTFRFPPLLNLARPAATCIYRMQDASIRAESQQASRVPASLLMVHLRLSSYLSPEYRSSVMARQAPLVKPSYGVPTVRVRVRVVEIPGYPQRVGS